VPSLPPQLLGSEGGDQAMMKIGHWPVGARLPRFLVNWRKITQDPWVLSVVEVGFKPTFVDKPPPVSVTPLLTRCDGEHRVQLLQAVTDLLAKKAVVRVWDYAHSPGYYSPYFLCPKKDGTLRPILNLKKFNKFLVKEKFRMETLSDVLASLEQDDWLISVDLKDAYLHVPIHASFHKYLRFAYLNDQGQTEVYQWVVLPFGLTSSPRVFTKVLVPLVRHVHSQGHKLNPYIDDLIGASRTREKSVEGAQLIVTTLLELGFLINVKKSTLIPTQDLMHLGARVQTQLGVVSVPWDKATAIAKQARALLKQRRIMVRQLSSFIGKLTACKVMLQWCMYHTRPLTRYQLTQYRPIRDKITKVIPLDQKAVGESLRFWSKENNILRGRCFLEPSTTHLVTTDASQFAYGGWFKHLTFTGNWDTKWYPLHINLKEMQTVYLALQNFQNFLTSGHVLIQSDNATVVAYLCRQGGMKSHSLDILARKVVRWCRGRDLTLSAVHIAGADNCLADRLSRPGRPVKRDLFKSTEWALSQEIANQIFQRWGTPTVDLFATRENRKVPAFYSRAPDPLALPATALTVAWIPGLFYLYARYLWLS